MVARTDDRAFEDFRFRQATRDFLKAMVESSTKRGQGKTQEEFDCEMDKALRTMESINNHLS